MYTGISQIPPFTEAPVEALLWYLWISAPIWVPLILLRIFWIMWMKYIRSYFIRQQGWILLELRLPQEITRSPRAMEIVLTEFFQKGKPSHLLDTFWNGKVPPWFSLELVSNGGYIHFYVWCWRKFKRTIESQFYSQYPNVEVVEVEDYATNTPFDPEKQDMFGCQFKKSGPNPQPIKTYKEYELEKAPKAEVRDDPLTAVLEFMGGCAKGEHVWIQLLIEAHKEEGLRYGRLLKKPDWKGEAEQEIQKIRDQYAINKEEGKYIPMTATDSQEIQVIREALEKFPFDTCIRAGYIADKEVFDSANISGLIGTMRQFSSAHRNGLSVSWQTTIDEPWKDFRRIRRRRNERLFLDAYRRRSFFQPPYRHFKQKPFVLTTEEIATIFHLPGSEAVTPTLPRVTSRKGEAPSNLPSGA